LSQSDGVRLLMQVRNFRQFLEQVLFDDRLEDVASIDSSAALNKWASQHPNSDFARFLQLCDALQLDQLGSTQNQFMSYGAYALPTGHLFQQGVMQWNQNKLQQVQLDTNQIEEDIAYSWLDGKRAHPFNGETKPDANAPGYSWCKAPRLNNQVVETGALARQLVNGHPLLLDLVNAKQGGSVKARVVARLLEFALVVPAMEQWCQQLQPSEPFCAEQTNQPQQGTGQGLVEAARGSLGHWLTVEDGRIKNYQIIAPTTWNFSPRDKQGTPGALESALENIPVDSDNLHDCLAIQHVIRSFDPCMVCTVH